MEIAIIGAGAAGCFAAANIPAGKGIEVTVFEKTSKALQKVKVSGGGRCNVTHACFDIPELSGKYPRGKSLLKKALHHFSPADTIEWFRSRGVQLKTEADGRMFPVTDDSQTIIDCLRREMTNKGVKVLFNKALSGIKKKEGKFRLQFADGTIHTADKVLLATGGYPKPEQYEWLRALGIDIKKPVPSLFTFNMPKHPITELMGLSVEQASVKIQGSKISESGPLLITHWGMSGPAILRTSAVAARELAERNYHFTIQVNWLGNTSELELREQIQELRSEQGKQFVQHKNPFSLPRRLWEYIVGKACIKEDTRWGDLPAAGQNKLIECLLRDSYEVKGKTTFKEEFVTCGGVELSGIEARTMESRVVPGLYFAGELMDVDGITGGFNFQAAWCSGYIAAKSMCTQEDAQ